MSRQCNWITEKDGNDGKDGNFREGRFAQNLSKSYYKISQLLSFVVICCRLLFNNKDNIYNIDNIGL